jgi:hypothetical protein
MITRFQSIIDDWGEVKKDVQINVNPGKGGRK